MTDNSNGSSAGNDNLAFRAALARGLVSRRSAMMGAAGLGAAAFHAALAAHALSDGMIPDHQGPVAFTYSLLLVITGLALAGVLLIVPSST